MINRNRTPSEYVCYGLYLYFSGLSLRRASERLSCFVKRNHVSIWNWIQKYHPKKISSKRKRIAEYIIDETLIKVGSQYIWLWIGSHRTKKQTNSRTSLANKSKERNMLIAERFISGLVRIHGKHPVSTDRGTWYPQACRFLNLSYIISTIN